jgi:hypothetical protein
MVLAQVPLSRFVRVPTRHSYSEWLQRVGALSADLLVCDTGSRVLAVIDVRANEESAAQPAPPRALARVLQAAGVRVHVWREGHLPGQPRCAPRWPTTCCAARGPMAAVATPSRDRCR